MAAEQRIYTVSNDAVTHLVQASSPAQALRHVAGKTYAVNVAKGIDVAQLMSKGIQLEMAKTIPEQGTLQGVD